MLEATTFLLYTRWLLAHALTEKHRWVYTANNLLLLASWVGLRLVQSPYVLVGDGAAACVLQTDLGFYTAIGYATCAPRGAAASVARAAHARRTRHTHTHTHAVDTRLTTRMRTAARALIQGRSCLNSRAREGPPLARRTRRPRVHPADEALQRVARAAPTALPHTRAPRRYALIILMSAIWLVQLLHNGLHAFLVLDTARQPTLQPAAVLPFGSGATTYALRPRKPAAAKRA